MHVVIVAASWVLSESDRWLWDTGEMAIVGVGSGVGTGGYSSNFSLTSTHGNRPSFRLSHI